jgi:drug/metabolite transporter (DMT)-like permease
MPQRRTLALFSLVLLMIMWGSTFVVTKATSREVPAATLAALRFFIASLVLVPIAWRQGGFARLPRPIPWRPLVLMALTGIAGFAITFNFALVYGSAAQGALIYAALPAAIAAAAFLFLKEQPSGRRLAGIVLSIVGVSLLIVTGERDVGSPNPIAGALWMIGAVISWTAYTVLSKRMEGSDSVISITLVSVIGTCVLIPIAAIELTTQHLQAPSMSAWAGLIFLGVVASALAYLVYGYVLRQLDASLVGVYTNLDPIVGVLIAILFFGEVLHSGQVLGGLIALIGMWLASSESKGEAH